MDLTSLPEPIAKRLHQITQALSAETATLEDLAKAAASCEDLLSFDRTNAGALFLLATTYMKVQKFGVAENLFHRALQIQPKAAEVYNNLGYICHTEGRIDEAEEAFKMCLELQPGNIEAMSNLASVFVNNGTPERALAACDACLLVAPNQADAKWNRALALLEMGRWAEGWDAYKAGLELATGSSVRRKTRYATLPYWSGSADDYVVVYGEQGLGDEIMGYSMVNDLIANDVNFILEVHPRLVTLIRTTWPDVPVYGTRKVEDDGAMILAENPDLTAKIPLLGLGGIYRRTDESFKRGHLPYLWREGPDEWYEEVYRLIPDLKAPRVGLSWSGGTMPTRGDIRSLPLGAYLPMMKRFGDRVQWVSMQYDPAEAPGLHTHIVEAFNRDNDVNLIHEPTLINDIDLGYTGLLVTCDLVISVNTSLVHACGALGTQCVCLTPTKPAWRYGLSGNRMPWYGEHVTVERQPMDGDWGAPLDAAEDRVAALLGEFDA